MMYSIVTRKAVSTSTGSKTTQMRTEVGTDGQVLTADSTALGGVSWQASGGGGDVNVTNGAGTSAVNVQDGGNSITVDDGGTPISIDDGGGSVTVDGPLTNTELRASPVAVSGTFYQATQPVSGPLTDTQLRATAVPVSGTFYQATQPVSAASLPLPTSAAKDSTLTDGTQRGSMKLLDSAGTNAASVSATGAVKVDGSAATQPVSGTFWQATQPVSGTFWQATQPVSAASLPLPTGAATAAKQPALGTAGAASADVITVQGIASMTALKVDGSAATQPVSGTFWPATQPVSGTFWQATQPVSGPLTDAQLRASAVPVSIAATAVTFIGRASTFRTPGRAGTAGQKILSLHNATGSTVTVKMTKVVIDLACTVVKAITVLPPAVRLWKVTVLPTNGTALTKNKVGGSGASSASVTVLGDASADGTNSASALTATLPAGAILTQEFAPRFITAAGYEPADRMEFMPVSDWTLGPLEGIVLFLDYTLATMNPTTDMWLASIEWTES